MGTYVKKVRNVIGDMLLYETIISFLIFSVIKFPGLLSMLSHTYLVFLLKIYNVFMQNCEKFLKDLVPPLPLL